MQPYIFYDQHLDKVSRSFSFCIRTLFSPAKEWVALSYLLCRTIDLIEDSFWPNKTAQYDAFQQLRSFLMSFPQKELFLFWLNNFPAQLLESEKQLLLDLPLLLEDKNQLPPTIHKALLQASTQMIDGMVYFLQEYKKEDIIHLPSLAITNQYCFVVAGLVGKLLSQIFTHLIPEFRWSTTLLNQSVHFGLFLQKINLLKDKKEDEAAGRFYISSRQELRASLLPNAQQAFNYLKAIPILSGRKYRLFCAWSLFIGLASLKWIDKSWYQQANYKISTQETNYLLKQVTGLIDDNHALERLFKQYLSNESL